MKQFGGVETGNRAKIYNSNNQFLKVTQDNSTNQILLKILEPNLEIRPFKKITSRRNVFGKSCFEQMWTKLGTGSSSIRLLKIIALFIKR